VQNSKESFGDRFYKEYGSEGDSLLFEDKMGTGTADFMTEKELKKLILSRYNHRFEFVFVAACHSEFAGKIFRSAGAKHVICVDYQNEVADHAVLKFTERFYFELFSGNTVCEAFHLAKENIHFELQDIKEANKFKILLPPKAKDSVNCDPSKNFCVTRLQLR
jgi:hypothetical protein